MSSNVEGYVCDKDKKKCQESKHLSSHMSHVGDDVVKVIWERRLLWEGRERKKICGGGEIFIPWGGGTSRELAQEGHRKRQKKREVGSNRQKKQETRHETRDARSKTKERCGRD